MFQAGASGEPRNRQRRVALFKSIDDDNCPHLQHWQGQESPISAARCGLPNGIEMPYVHTTNGDGYRQWTLTFRLAIRVIMIAHPARVTALQKIMRPAQGIGEVKLLPVWIELPFSVNS